MKTFAKLAITAIAMLSLGACGVARPAQEEKDRSANLQSALSNCETATFKTRLERSRCIGNAEEAYLVPGSPVADLIRVKIATRNSIAERLDMGKITQAEADLETAKAASELVGEAKQRSASSRIAQAQENAADAAAARNKPVTCYGGPQFASCF